MSTSKTRKKKITIRTGKRKKAAEREHRKVSVEIIY